MDREKYVYYIDEMLHQLNEDDLKIIYNIVMRRWLKKIMSRENYIFYINRLLNEISDT